MPSSFFLIAAKRIKPLGANRTLSGLKNIFILNSGVKQLIAVNKGQIQAHCVLPLKNFTGKRFREFLPDFITTLPDRRPESSENILRVAFKCPRQHLHRFADDLKRAALPSGMDKTDTFLMRVVKKHREAIRGPHRQDYAGDIGHHRIRFGDITVLRNIFGPDNQNTVPMDLAHRINLRRINTEGIT